jgi:hypothetical protein
MSARPWFVVVFATFAAGCGDARTERPDASGLPPDRIALADDAMPADGAPEPVVEFTETYDMGTMDVGNWILTTNTQQPREIQPFKGNPDGWLLGQVSAAVPAWGTTSTRYQPGANNPFSRDSIFVSDYQANNIQVLSADLLIVQPGVWTAQRTVTLRLRTWNDPKNNILFDATYSLPNIPTVPVGWNRYEFRIDARSPTIPPGWVLRLGGVPAANTDWARFTRRIDFVALELGKPGFVYPSLGVWRIGIDNIHIGTPLPPQ